MSQPSPSSPLPSSHGSDASTNPSPHSGAEQTPSRHARPSSHSSMDSHEHPCCVQAPVDPPELPSLAPPRSPPVVVAVSTVSDDVAVDELVSVPSPSVSEPVLSALALAEVPLVASEKQPTLPPTPPTSATTEPSTSRPASSLRGKRRHARCPAETETKAAKLHVSRLERPRNFAHTAFASLP